MASPEVGLHPEGMPPDAEDVVLGTVSLTSEGEVWWTSFETGQG